MLVRYRALWKALRLTSMNNLTAPHAIAAGVDAAETDKVEKFSESLDIGDATNSPTEEMSSFMSVITVTTGSNILVNATR
jgi:hypothetical protein